MGVPTHVSDELREGCAQPMRLLQIQRQLHRLGIVQLVKGVVELLLLEKLLLRGQRRRLRLRRRVVLPHHQAPVSSPGDHRGTVLSNRQAPHLRCARNTQTINQMRQSKVP